MLGKKFIMGATAEQHVSDLRGQTVLCGWTSGPYLGKSCNPALHQLVQEQLQSVHIVPTTSPWNFPGFVIQKKIGT